MDKSPKPQKVLLFGTFDHFHPGHQFVLDEAAKHGEVFVVIARDCNVEKIKKLKPSHNEEERMRAVQFALPSATVVLGDPVDFLAPVRAIKPDLILLGYDQRMPPGVAEDQLGAPVERLPSFDPHIHKSSILREVRDER